MATPIDNKALLQQFIGDDEDNKDHSVDTLPKAENVQPKNTEDHIKGQKKNLRFSITVPAPLAITIREYVTQATIAHLMNGKGYSLSQFFSDAALHYIKFKEDH